MTGPSHYETTGLAKLRDLVYTSKYLVALTGAGISTASGIPDFRSQDGIYSKYPDAEKLATYDLFVSDPEIRKKAWLSQLHSPIWNASPNKAHQVLASLEKRGLLKSIITQNIDGLHQLAGNCESCVIEIHGTCKKAVCLSCSFRYEMSEILKRVENGELDPRCERKIDNSTNCNGIIKADTISFGQALDPDVVARATDEVTKADVLLVIGTSLVVYPAASLVPLAYESGAKIIIINKEPTSYDYLAELVINQDVSTALATLET